MADVVTFLKEKTLAQVVKSSNIVEANTTDTAYDGFRKLVDNGILSVPLKNPSDGTYVAFLDVLDILHYVAIVPSGTVESSLKTITCQAIANLSKRNNFVPIHDSTNLINVIQTFCTNYKDLHRLPMIDNHGKLIGVVSQSLLVTWLAPHVTKFDFGKQTVGQLGLGLEIKSVITVHKTDQVSVALQKIKDNSVSAVGVVDENGKLVGNFSASDIKYVGLSQTLKLSSSTLADFLSALQLPKNGSDYPYTVTKNNHMTTVVKKFCDTKAHRLFVVDGHGAPIGVISLVDIIELFLRHILIE